ncbi:MAG: acyltransferase [Bacteroidaceae bacterium]|nr:acyltransferase [Bacteroidaceae bacterium]
MRQRIGYLDVLRVFACFLVVLTHSVMENKAENGIWLGFLSLLCSPSSELFLALSGAILLPIHTDMEYFYKRRFLKLLPPMFIWSTFGIVLHLIQNKTTCSEAFIQFICLPLKPAISVYWFLYVMVGLYLLAPIISFWLRQATKKQVELFLLIWGINMIVPWLNLLFPNFYNQDGSYYWPICYFGGFLGYWMLGYYLKTYKIKLNSFKGITIFILSLIYIILLFLLKTLGIDITPYYDNLQFGSALLVCSIFILVKEISDSTFGNRYLNNYASAIAKYSFGIYLLHIFVVRDGIWLLMNHFRLYNHPIIESIFIACISIAFCIIIIKILSMFHKSIGKWCFGIN